MKFTKLQRVFRQNAYRQLRKINLRAASALLIFLLGWSVLPAAMWAQEPDTCSMECCVAEGHCCCATAKPFVEGHDYSSVDEIGQPEIFSTCQNLATPPSNAKVFSRQILQNFWHEPTANQPPPLIGHQHSSGYRSLRFTPKSPRAPPESFLTV